MTQAIPSTFLPPQGREHHHQPHVSVAPVLPAHEPQSSRQQQPRFPQVQQQRTTKDQQYQQMLQQHAPPHSAPHKRHLFFKKATAEFESADLDQTGYLTKTQSKALLQHNPALKFIHGWVIFPLADSDKNGQIDFAEFLKIRQRFSMVRLGKKKKKPKKEKKDNNDEGDHSPSDGWFDWVGSGGGWKGFDLGGGGSGGGGFDFGGGGDGGGD